MNLIEKISESEPLRNQLKKLLSYMENLTEAGKRINRKDFERQYNLNVLSILVEILMLLRSQRLSLTELKEVDRILIDYIQWFDLSEEDKMNSQMELLSCLATHGYSSVVQTKKEELIKQYPNHELQILGSIFNGLKICRKDIERLRKEAKQIKPKNETEFMILKEIVNYR